MTMALYRDMVARLPAFVLLAWLPVAAQSATYSAAAGYYHTVGGSAPGTYATSEAGGSASATVGPANGGTINVFATSLGAPDNYNGMVADGWISYDVQFVGMSNISVPVRVQAHGYAQGSGNGYQADTSFSITGQNFSTVGASAETSSSDPFVSFVFDQMVSFSSNTSYHVQLFASASAVFRNGGGTASAFVDPVFTIDPAYANNFTIVGVPGQTGAVPEPAAWAMMVGGFGLVGSAMRRRQRVCFA
jgi:hypothetical protein